MSQFAGNLSEKCEPHIAQGPKSVTKSFQHTLFFLLRSAALSLRKAASPRKTYWESGNVQTLVNSSYMDFKLRTQFFIAQVHVQRMSEIRMRVDDCV